MINKYRPILLTMFMALSNLVYSQKVCNQKGFLFFSKSYEMLLDSLKLKDNVELLFVPDIFFPVQKNNSKKLYYNDFIKGNIQKGICLSNINKREMLKIKAKKFLNVDTSQCYTSKEFFLLPIRIKYIVMSKDNMILPCNSPLTVLGPKGEMTLTFSDYDIKVLSINSLQK